MHIREFQEMTKTLYLHRDSERGLKGTYEWLMEEVKELGEALDQKDRIAAEKELADVIAWLVSLANITEIDLETAAISKYSDKCPNVSNRPADAFSKKPSAFALVRLAATNRVSCPFD